MDFNNSWMWPKWRSYLLVTAADLVAEPFTHGYSYHSKSGIVFTTAFVRSFLFVFITLPSFYFLFLRPLPRGYRRVHWLCHCISTSSSHFIIRFVRLQYTIDIWYTNGIIFPPLQQAADMGTQRWNSYCPWSCGAVLWWPTAISYHFQATIRPITQKDIPTTDFIKPAPPSITVTPAYNTLPVHNYCHSPVVEDASFERHRTGEFSDMFFNWAE